MVESKSLTIMKRIINVFLLLYSVVLCAQDQKVFSIGSIHANPGEKVSGKLIVAEGIDTGSFIPVTIIHGKKPGPVLTLNAGLHGTEYVPIVVLQKLLKIIEPEQLSGTVILVHIANIPAFKGMSVYSSPVDRKNINRVFPGKIDGTLSERIAFKITNEIIAKSDYYIDLHGGEFTEQIVDYIYFIHNCPDKDLCEKIRMLAHATGNHYLIPDKLIIPDEASQGTYSEHAAIRLGVPAVSLEWGDQGRVDSDVVEFALRGMVNVMQTLEMIEGKPFVNEYPVYLFDESAVTCNFDGLLYAEVNKGQFVTKGSRLGYTTDYWGNVLEEYYSTITGVVVVVRNVPVINKGENICRVARVSDTFEK